MQRGETLADEAQAIRALIAQDVDAIFITPAVKTGWTSVLKEAGEAKIPVFLLDRLVENKGFALHPRPVND
jgi:simple sugar transport system substrate-binding protein